MQTGYQVVQKRIKITNYYIYKTDFMIINF